jgi:CHASE2 domain-containing sensor protein
MLGILLGGRYKIIRLLGYGGFGQTYLAEDTQHSAAFYCVVKHFHPTSQDASTLQVARRLFHTEAEILRRLGKHDQIPALIDFFEEGDDFYLVEEFIEGITLSQEIRDRGRLTEEEVIDLLRDVLSLLDFVHTHNVIHRDIKPSNLIRRKEDGKIGLIDFGAVKELQTQLLGESGHTSFTVGIGTQGYTPSEQLAGSPRFCSDIYALGVTAIQALTGLQPAQLDLDPDTSELVWQGNAEVSLGLSFVLDNMVRYHFSQRYQSAKEVLRALDQLLDLPTDLTTIPPSMLLPQRNLRDRQLAEDAKGWRRWVNRSVGVAIAITTLTSSLVLGVRQMGLLEPLELASFDQMMRLRPDTPPDPRLLIVEITEEDLQQLQRTTPSDQDLATVLDQIQQYKPSVIGLDLHRDLPQDPGHDALLERLQAPNLIAITKLGETSADRIPAPKTVPPERVGFSDIPIDPDDVVRRGLLFASTEEGVFYSFSIRVAFAYLINHNIQPSNSEENSAYVQVGSTVFLPLTRTSGAYQQLDSAGYQMLLNYRSRDNVARHVSFTDVLQGKLQADWVEDKIVLIGTTAISARDVFNTPYSAGQNTDYLMPGVTVHAQMVSQWLDASLGERGLFWFFPDSAELGWIVLWAMLGGAIAWFVSHPILLGSTTIGLIVILSGTGFLIFLNNGWVPVASPIIALLITETAVALYRGYEVQKSQKALKTFIWNSTPGKLKS